MPHLWFLCMAYIWLHTIHKNLLLLFSVLARITMKHICKKTQLRWTRTASTPFSFCLLFYSFPSYIWFNFTQCFLDSGVLVSTQCVVQSLTTQVEEILCQGRILRKGKEFRVYLFSKKGQNLLEMLHIIGYKTPKRQTS